MHEVRMAPALGYTLDFGLSWRRLGPLSLSQDRCACRFEGFTNLLQTAL